MRNFIDSKLILAIDPGPRASSGAVCDCWEDGAFQVRRWIRDAPNPEMLVQIARLPGERPDQREGGSPCPRVVCEWIENYGGVTGAPTYDTARWVGRFEDRTETCGMPPMGLIKHPDISLAICANRRAKDPQLHQAIVDIFGGDRSNAKGTKAEPGPIYGIADHLWDALAVAIAWANANVVVSPATVHPGGWTVRGVGGGPC